MKHYYNFISGRFTPSTNSYRVEVTNPSTGAVVCTVPDSSSTDDVDTAVSAAEKAKSVGRGSLATQRAEALRSIAQRIHQNAEPLARVIVEEQGKILSLARIEVSFTADYFDFMAEWAHRIEGEILESDRGGESIFLFRQVADHFVKQDRTLLSRVPMNQSTSRAFGKTELRTRGWHAFLRPVRRPVWIGRLCCGGHGKLQPALRCYVISMTATNPSQSSRQGDLRVAANAAN